MLKIALDWSCNINDLYHLRTTKNTVDTLHQCFENKNVLKNASIKNFFNLHLFNSQRICYRNLKKIKEINMWEKNSGKLSRVRNLGNNYHLKITQNTQNTKKSFSVSGKSDAIEIKNKYVLIKHFLKSNGNV